MKGMVSSLSRSRQHAAIRTEDGDYAIVRVPGRELRVNDLVNGDLINPGVKNISCGAAPISVYVEECRIGEDVAAEKIALLGVLLCVAL